MVTSPTAGGSHLPSLQGTKPWSRAQRACPFSPHHVSTPPPLCGPHLPSLQGTKLIDLPYVVKGMDVSFSGACVCVCVCVCACACVRACVRACVGACICVCVCVFVVWRVSVRPCTSACSLECRFARVPALFWCFFIPADPRTHRQAS